MNEFKISVIIRTFNEAAKIDKVLKSIFKQNYKNFEVIIVDSESTDATLKICEKYNLKIVKIKKKDFNYSYASNVGASYATGDILYFLSGHSKIKHRDTFKILTENFNNSKIGGVYGDALPYFRSGIAEGIFYRLGALKNLLRPKKIENSIHPGILSCSNAAIRKTIFLKHNFVIELGEGGEDVEMANYIIQSGYLILFNRHIMVYHSHNKNLANFKKELDNWKKLYNNVEKYISEHDYE